MEDSSSYSEELEFDPEWLAVLRRTHTLLKTQRGDVHLPQQVDKVSEEVSEILFFIFVFFYLCALGLLRIVIIHPFP